MSMSFVIVVPADPRYLPTTEAAEEAARYLWTLFPRAAGIVTRLAEHVEFHDCGANFQEVRCPFCGVELELRAWREWMDADFDGTGFHLRTRVLRCCGGSVTLNDLNYRFEQRFARFSINVREPNAAAIDADAMRQLSGILNTDVRVVFRHV